MFLATPRGQVQSQPIGISSAVETQHASLRRKKGDKPDGSPAERSQSLQADVSSRPLSLVIPSQSDVNMAMSPSAGSLRGVSVPLH